MKAPFHPVHDIISIGYPALVALNDIPVGKRPVLTELHSPCRTAGHLHAHQAICLDAARRIVLVSNLRHIPQPPEEKIQRVGPSIDKHPAPRVASFEE